MELTAHWLWIVAAAAVLLVVLAFAVGTRRTRTAGLRERFGSEYEHAVQQTGNRKRGERELLARTAEAKSFDIRSLSPTERDHYQSEWRRLESRFLERPTTAVVEADELIRHIMEKRGYPMGDFERHAAHLSVQNPRIVQHYRAGHAVIDDHRRGQASTEELRQAMLHYRKLFAEVVGERSDSVMEVPVSYEIGNETIAVRPTVIEASDERPRDVNS